MSSEIDDAVGTAPVRVEQLLKEKRDALSQARKRYEEAKANFDEQAIAEEMRTIAALEAILPELVRRVDAEREDDAVRRAAKRAVAISRAHGSLVKQLDEDEKRVVQKIAELKDALATLNQRYTRAAQLRAEGAALADRFGVGVGKPPLDDLIPPVRRDFVAELATLEGGLLDHASIYQAQEDDEFRLRTRRTYRELDPDCEGFKIITAAGLRAWPPLTQKQEEIVAGRQRQAESTRRAFAGLPKIPSEGNSPIGGI